jgi:hypothetical protein
VEQTQSRIEERDLHADYARDEQSYRSAAARLVQRELELRSRIRSCVEADPAERQSAYMEGHQAIQAEYDRLTEDFSRRQSQALVEAQRKLYKGSGTEAYHRALAEASAAPDERLPELAKLAAQSGLRDLEQAVAVVADQHSPGGRSPLFRDWVAKDPDRVAAHDRLRRTPGPAQFHARTLGVKPPKADARDLQPTAADEQRAAAEEAARQRPRQEFFGKPQPRRQVGSRIF